MKATHRETWSNIFYWIGVVAAFLTVALVFIGHSKWGSGLERTGFPLAWKLAVVSILALLAREMPATQPSARAETGHARLDRPHPTRNLRLTF